MSTEKTHRVVVYQECPIYRTRDMVGKGYPMSEEKAKAVAADNNSTEQNPNRAYVVELVEG